MKNILIGFVVLVFTVGIAEARGHGHSSRGYSSGSTHSVRGYVRKNGTYVQPHRSGNPGSGIHCHNNVCY
jgi:hypothetical protein